MFFLCFWCRCRAFFTLVADSMYNAKKMIIFV